MTYERILEFEDEIGDEGAVVSGIDGRRQMLGAYMSIIEWKPLNEVCTRHSIKNLEYIQKYYEGESYLSPVFGVLASFIKIIIGERKTRILETKKNKK